MKVFILSIFTAAIAMATMSSTAPNCVVIGHIADETDKSSIIGAKVIVTGKDISAISDFDGNFKLTVEKGSYTLQAKYVGYETNEQKVSCNADTVRVEVLLTPQTKTIEELKISTGAEDKELDVLVVTGSKYSTKSASTKHFRAEGKAAAAKTYKWADSDDAMEAAPAGGTYSVKTTTSTAGTLTAGEINDFSKWKMWNDLKEGEFRTHSNTWQFFPDKRYVVQASNEDGFPLVDAAVTLVDESGTSIWKTRTDNTGKAELWHGFFDSTAKRQSARVHAIVEFGSERKTIEKLNQFPNGVNKVSFNQSCGSYDVADILFAVDATGSMGDEIRYLQDEMQDIIQKVKAKNKAVRLRTGAVFYRDHGDEYVTRTSEFTEDIKVTNDFINSQSAGGGGDFPEAVEEAFVASLQKMQWSKNARTRIMFLVLDAPPHGDDAIKEKLRVMTMLAAEKGVRIVPVTCSGIDKSTEFLMRTFALATNGTYTFLTDHSGVGGKHIAPSTDKYDVEKLNDLITRLILQYTYYPDCEQFLAQKDSISKDLIAQTEDNFELGDSSKKNSNLLEDPFGPSEFLDNVKLYPNPTLGQLTAEIKGDVTELFLTDINGKVLERFTGSRHDKIQMNLSAYSAGIYFVRYLKEDKWKAGKVILVKS
jgi:hypothetical protein